MKNNHVDVDEELANIENTMEHNNRKLKKKERHKLSQERQRQILGMNNNAFEEVRNDDMFNLLSASNVKKVSGVDFEDLDSLGDDFEGDNVSDDNISENDVDDYESEESEVYNKPKRVKGDHENSEVWFSHPMFQETLLSSDTTTQNPLAGDDDDYENMMPKTDKEIRKSKRKRVEERNKRKKVVPLVDDDDEPIVSSGGTGIAPMVGSGNLQISNDYRDQIAAGMGSYVDTKMEFEVVSENFHVPEVKDDRVYFNQDEATTLDDKISDIALGTLMLTKSKRKAIVDSSYNRYSWNDPDNLPDWFVDDELRHNKPEIPVPAALVNQIKGRFTDVGSKDIKKVAEARMRKRKRAMTQLKAAKKKAKSMFESNEVSNRQKIKVGLSYF